MKGKDLASKKAVPATHAEIPQRTGPRYRPQPPIDMSKLNMAEKKARRE